ncbi:hypothetical protein GCM10010885_14800 [Alicyclobacillus cellulosilyticus]|uniref:Uncharacterized protein n=1 Tax=Alicyclobacillus cellulosilyticus TaxID=1003997 RepID=A0A917KAD6_9BACL|nr:hypothetical protein [Alicyclobacillus cellulosilyticus]GGJ06693.1 hypothetical protein GCM10010885_14800 [Alicyclobacillus cellulosilyticus]
MQFLLDERLGIPLPNPELEFEQLTPAEQEEVIAQWERIKARIPEQILKFEAVIEDKLRQVHEREDWDEIAALFAEISDYASRINELNTWRRVDPLLHPDPVADHASEHRDREKG